MGEHSFLEKCWVVLKEALWSCRMFGHQFKYEPLPGDLPPFEFMNCAHCGFENPTFNHLHQHSQPEKP